MFGANGDARVAILDVEHRAGDVGRHELERLVAGIDLRRQNVFQHRRRDLASLAAEQIERRTTWNSGADGGITERNADLGDVVATDELLGGLVLRVDVADVPGDPFRTCSEPLSPPLKYQVSTSWLKMRSPASIGRRVIQPKFATLFPAPVPHVGDATAHRSIPYGLKGFRWDTLMVSAMPPVPAKGPTKIGSGAAWLVEVRLLNTPFAYSWILSVASYVRFVNSALRCEGVSSRFSGAKLKRSAPLQ